MDILIVVNVFQCKFISIFRSFFTGQNCGPNIQNALCLKKKLVNGAPFLIQILWRNILNSLALNYLAPRERESTSFSILDTPLWEKDPLTYACKIYCPQFQRCINARESPWFLRGGDLPETGSLVGGRNANHYFYCCKAQGVGIEQQHNLTNARCGIKVNLAAVLQAIIQ